MSRPLPYGAEPGPGGGSDSGSTGPARGQGGPAAPANPDGPVVSLHRPVSPQDGRAPDGIEVPSLLPGTGGSAAPGAALPPALKAAATAAGPPAGKGEEGPRLGASGLPGPAAEAPRRPAVPLRPARIGSGETTIYVECRPDVVVVYPGRKQIGYDSLNHSPQHNPLCQEVRRWIARRQALVAPGEPAPRVGVRFLIHKGGEQTFHRAYPALYTVVPPGNTARYNLQPDDDVARIIAEN